MNSHLIEVLVQIARDLLRDFGAGKFGVGRIVSIGLSSRCHFTNNINRITHHSLRIGEIKIAWSSKPLFTNPH